MVTTRGMASLAATQERPNAKRRGRWRSPSPPPTPPLSPGAAALAGGYEVLRDQGIKENLEGLQDAKGREQRRSPTSSPPRPLSPGAAANEGYERLRDQGSKENLEGLQDATGREQRVSPASSPPPPLSPGAATPEGYEKLRDERIKENLERLQKLGILNLSLQLKSQLQLPLSSAPSYQQRRKRDTVPGTTSGHRPPTLPPRRSSRLQHITPVSYAEIHVKKDVNSKINSSISIEEGAKEEVYTDEHEKLLGTYETSWTLFVDGYDNDGKRIYDQIRGKTCHQCRQKTLGHRTHCSKCKIVQGQFCGDCLFIRYGENVLEASKNPIWICPVCRGICNCSFCRIKKGWAPTGPLYRKITSLGYKSVAHYLIQTRQQQTSSGDLNSSKLVTAEDSSHLENCVEFEDGIEADSHGKNCKIKKENASRTDVKPIPETGVNNSEDSNSSKSVTAEDSSHLENCVELEGGVEADFNRKNIKIKKENESRTDVKPILETGVHSSDEDSAENVSNKSTIKLRSKTKKENKSPLDAKPSTGSIASRLRKRHRL